MDDHVVKELMTTVNCAVCGRRYEAADINILYHQHELWFISVFCRSCRTKGLVAALLRESGEAPSITELTPEEVARFGGAPPISADDILDLHKFLEDFDGDFASLFGHKGPQS